MRLDVTTSWQGDSFDRAFEELEKELEAVVRGLTVRLWNSILIKTPQAHGTLVASWSYSIGSPHYVDREQMVDLEGGMYRVDRRDSNLLRRRGDPETIGIANTASAGKERQFKLGDIVYIANGANHGEGEYAALVEAGEISLRAVNRPGEMVRRSLDMIKTRYGENIKSSQSKELGVLFIGGPDAG